MQNREWEVEGGGVAPASRHVSAAALISLKYLNQKSGRAPAIL